MLHLVPPRPQHVTIIRGWPVKIDWLWLIVTITIAAITLESVAPSREGRSLMAWYALAVLVVIGIVASLIVHSAAHIVVARRVGHPIRTFEPALLGNLSDAAFPPITPRTEALVAVAGPIASALAALVCFAAVFLTPSSIEQLEFGWTILGIANLALLALSLIPGFPYDGGRALRAFVWYLSDDLVVGTKVAAYYGQFLGVFAFFLALVSLAAGEPYSVWGAWALLFLWAINRASREGVERTFWSEASRSATVGDLAFGGSSRIDAGLTIDAAIDEVLGAVNHGPVLVTEDGEVMGVFNLGRIRQVPRALWAERHVRDVAAPIDELPCISAEAGAAALLNLFDSGAELVLIESSSPPRVTGALDRETAERRLRERIPRDRRPRSTTS